MKQFGREVLKHPQIVKSIESEFIPLLVYNNRSVEMDLELLRRYNEPAWNYQVIRFIDAKGDDIIPRKDRIWTIKAVASRMIEALKAAERPIPEELIDLAGR